MSKRDLFAEISSALSDAKQHDYGKLTLKLYRSPKLNHKYSVKLNHPSISSSIFFI